MCVTHKSNEWCKPYTLLCSLKISDIYERTMCLWFFGLVIPFCGFFWSVFLFSSLFFSFLRLFVSSAPHSVCVYFFPYIPWPLVNGFYALLLLYTMHSPISEKASTAASSKRVCNVDGIFSLSGKWIGDFASLFDTQSSNISSSYMYVLSYLVSSASKPE